MPRPREYDDDLRVRLIETAAQLLADEGPHAVTTRRVAAEVGTSTTAIYSLLGSKEELFRAMYREGFQRLSDHLAAAPRSDDAVEDLRRLGTEYHAMGMESPQLYRVMFDCPIPEFAIDDEDVTFSLGTLQVLIDAVRRCVDEGHFAGDPRELALELWSMSHGITSLAIAGMLGSPEAAQERLDHLSAAVYRGMLTSPAIS
jgi:AcrR family transcriptional regulator